MKSLLLSSALSGGLLFLLSFISNAIGFVFSFNITTSLISVLLGIPGIISMLLINLL